MRCLTAAGAMLLGIALFVSAQTTQPSGRDGSIKSQSADQLLNQMLKPTTNPARQPDLVPDAPVTDKAAGNGAVKPGAPKVNVIREGTFLFDRVARVTKGNNGQTELTFDSDGKALHDPPMILLPNLKLQQMEDTLAGAGRDLRFRVTVMVTEYRGRNYAMVERFLTIDPALQF